MQGQNDKIILIRWLLSKKHSREYPEHIGTSGANT